MMATRVFRANLGIPAGTWRWAALGFVALALAAAGLALAAPAQASWPGLALLAGIGAVGSLLLYAVWPRENLTAEEARRVAEAASRANVAWAITNADGAVIDCNNVYRRMAGAKDGEAAAPPELALMGEPSASVLYRLTRDAAEGKAREETLSIAPAIEIVAAVRPLKDKQTAWWFVPRLGGEAVGAGAAVSTVSLSAERPRAEQGFGDLFRGAPMGVAVADETGKLVESNAAFTEFFAAAEPRDRETIANLVAKAVAGQKAGPKELRAGERMAELFASPMAGAKRAILYLLDVSEQKALETKFAQSQKMQAVGQLAGGVAHDFNNLLTVIIGNSEFLLMRHPAGDPSFKEINEVHQNALRAANLVRQLLAFSRKQTLQPRTLALNDALAELGHLLRRLVGEGIEVKLENAPDLWPVHADESQISNAIINLVVNARDAMPKGGVVTIRTANETVAQPTAFGSGVMPAGDYVKIEVADRGIGISKEHLSKIFDPFFTTKPVGQGTGLGLATVYGIVKQTGGFITVDSDVGVGTIFRIYLPRLRSKTGGAAAAPESETMAPRDVTGQDTILLVEDEEAVRSFAARALRMRGYNVLEASGGEEALDVMKKQGKTIDLLITDVVMPNMDGPTLVRAVKRLDPAIRVIFMSGYAEEAFRRNDENAAEIHFLPKPFGLKQLAAKVKEVLSGAPVPKRVGLDES